MAATMAVFVNEPIARPVTEFLQPTVEKANASKETHPGRVTTNQIGLGRRERKTGYLGGFGRGESRRGRRGTATVNCQNPCVGSR